MIITQILALGQLIKVLRHDDRQKVVHCSMVYFLLLLLQPLLLVLLTLPVLIFFTIIKIFIKCRAFRTLKLSIIKYIRHHQFSLLK